LGRPRGKVKKEPLGRRRKSVRPSRSIFTVLLKKERDEEREEDRRGERGGA